MTDIPDYHVLWSEIRVALEDETDERRVIGFTSGLVRTEVVAREILIVRGSRATTFKVKGPRILKDGRPGDVWTTVTTEAEPDALRYPQAPDWLVEIGRVLR